MHHNNSPLLQRPIFETFATALCGTTGMTLHIVLYYIISFVLMWFDMAIKKHVALAWRCLPFGQVRRKECQCWELGVWPNCKTAPWNLDIILDIFPQNKPISSKIIQNPNNRPFQPFQWKFWASTGLGMPSSQAGSQSRGSHRCGPERLRHGAHWRCLSWMDQGGVVVEDRKLKMWFLIPYQNQIIQIIQYWVIDWGNVWEEKIIRMMDFGGRWNCPLKERVSWL